MNQDSLIRKTIAFVQETLKNAEGGHDWFHIERVWNTSLNIAATEPNSNLLVVHLGALLHDIADSKFHHGNDSLGSEIASDFLKKQQVETSIIEQVCAIIHNISFRSEKDSKYTSIELNIIKDADRLDAMGAIGIARAFNYGGYKNRALFNPNNPPNLNMSKEEYKKSNAPTINHFYEKLLLLKNGLTTEKGKKLGEERHAFLVLFLKQFYMEWYGDKINEIPSEFHVI